MATHDEWRSASQQRQRSTSRPRTPRPTTPLRPSSRSSFRESARGSVHSDALFPLNAFEPAFAELSDAMADLEANMMHFQIMHESLSRFTESFASFLYGVNMNAFCVEFPEAPVPESFARAKQMEENPPASMQVPEKSREVDADATFMTTDTSFVDNPPASSKAATPKKISSTRGTSRGRGTANTRGASTRGRASSGIARGTTRGARPSGLPRGRGMRPV
ncbi:hypothetical protein PpBr36_08268 [Pyricularia pennisetigena]|uniref:hypothetical protein n=1 Tax=Pyricularia pennisetigena TaxID=1578925 RepID=UPI001152073A|nr:hypothetical protein PpBr36_08268 [Pyricularia pennisetigena]TLS23963.1 hypothetical protein PpBr36_08268 [Pyricularia pennisetigena]